MQLPNLSELPWFLYAHRQFNHLTFLFYNVSGITHKSKTKLQLQSGI